MPLVNRIRPRANSWREAGYPGVTVLSDDQYAPLTPDASGLLHSRIFPGLRLAVQALLSGDVSGVLATQQTGIGTPEHGAFVEQLQMNA